MYWAEDYPEEGAWPPMSFLLAPALNVTVQVLRLDPEAPALRGQWFNLFTLEIIIDYFYN